MPFPSTVWGFDLSEARWSAFKGKNMFDKRWPHLRRERLFVYQLAQCICMGATLAATVSMAEYNHLQTHVQQFALAQTGLEVVLHNNDIIAGEILTLTFGAFISTLFGLEFIILVLWPGRTSYPKWYNYTRMTLPVIMTVGLLVAALVSTTVVFKRSAFITGASAEMQEEYTTLFFRPPLKYISYPANVVYVCFLWVGWVCTVAATILLIVGVRREMNAGTETKGIPPAPIQEDEKSISEFSEESTLRSPP